MSLPESTRTQSGSMAPQVFLYICTRTVSVIGDVEVLAKAKYSWLDDVVE